MGIIETLQEEVLQLRAEVDKLKYGFSFNGSIKAELSQQEIRNNIIKKAKDDIENLKDGDVYDTYLFGSNSCNTKFVIDKEKRTVVCLIKGWVSRSVYSKGIAKCEPDDCFNVYIGKSIALHRALGLDVPIEYYNAPNPTEVTVGDIVTWGGDNYMILRKENNYYDLRIVGTNEMFIGLNYADKYIVKLIVDDSREFEII